MDKHKILRILEATTLVIGIITNTIKLSDKLESPEKKQGPKQIIEKGE